MFFSPFVIIIIKITIIFIKIIIASIIIIIEFVFCHTRETSFLASEKRGPSNPNWGHGGGGLGDSGDALQCLKVKVIFLLMSSLIAFDHLNLYIQKHLSQPVAVYDSLW